LGRQKRTESLGSTELVTLLTFCFHGSTFLRFVYAFQNGTLWPSTIHAPASASSAFYAFGYANSTLFLHFFAPKNLGFTERSTLLRFFPRYMGVGYQSGPEFPIAIQNRHSKIHPPALIIT
jgi:hypothetical protein